MTDPKPRVSVVMAAYNGARHLREAVDSILGQTLQELELIVVDDASTDETPEILAAYARSDPRVSVLRNATNLGPFVSGNLGLAAARAPIIARMDSDDISHPDRLALQVGFLDTHPDHILVGNSYRAIDDTGHERYTKVKPTDAFGVRWTMRFRCPIEHPGSTFRAHLPDGTPVRYDETHPIAQDFELFARLTETGKAAILPQVLFSYRTHPTNISSTRTAEQRRISQDIALSVQDRDLPAAMQGRLRGVLACYLMGDPATTRQVRDGVAAIDAMLVHDVAHQPDAKRWLMRQSAAILAEAFLNRGGGFRNPRVLVAFLQSARRYLWPLVMRRLEDTGRLPRWLNSAPRIAPSPGARWSPSDTMVPR